MRSRLRHTDFSPYTSVERRVDEAALCASSGSVHTESRSLYISVDLPPLPFVGSAINTEPLSKLETIRQNFAQS